VITITTGSNPATPPGGEVWLTVRDTGVGLTPGERAKIFEPFFTTKRHGRGLGLAVVQGIVNGHRGSIDVESQKGEGTAVRISFPADQAMPAGSVPKSDGHAWTAKGTVLVSEGEWAVRKAARTVLANAGLTVITAENAEETVNAFHRYARGIRLVILGLVSSPVAKVLFELRAIRANVPIVLTPADIDLTRLRPLEGSTAIRILPKPYLPSDLLTQVRDLWDAEERPTIAVNRPVPVLVPQA
jgi:hypothetical protein